MAIQDQIPHRAGFAARRAERSVVWPLAAGTRTRYPTDDDDDDDDWRRVGVASATGTS